MKRLSLKTRGNIKVTAAMERRTLTGISIRAHRREEADATNNSTQEIVPQGDAWWCAPMVTAFPIISASPAT